MLDLARGGYGYSLISDPSPSLSMKKKSHKKCRTKSLEAELDEALSQLLILEREISQKKLLGNDTRK
jgi:hypothetical protein